MSRFVVRLLPNLVCDRQERLRHFTTMLCSILQGQIRVGPQVVNDPAFLVTRVRVFSSIPPEQCLGPDFCHCYSLNHRQWKTLSLGPTAPKSRRQSWTTTTSWTISICCENKEFLSVVTCNRGQPIARLEGYRHEWAWFTS